MKKLFRLAKAEFNKIFYRPSIFILTALLIMAIVATYIMYNPVATTTKLVYDDLYNVTDIYNRFTSEEKNTITKYDIDKKIEDNFNSVNNQYISITTDDKYETLKLMLNAYDTNFKSELLRLSTETEEFNKDTTKNTFMDLKTNLSNILNYLAKIKNQTLNFYFTTGQYDKMYKNLETTFNAYPNNFNEYKTKDDFIDFGHSIQLDFSIQKSFVIIEELKPEQIVIDKTIYEKLVEDYYTKAKTQLEETYLKAIETFYADHNNSDSEEDVKQINELIAQYSSYATMNNDNLLNNFTLLKLGNKTDDEIKNILGFTEISRYKTNEKITINDYLIKNNQFDYQFATSYNFNVASSTNSNACDYTVYTMQILIILITIFTMFYACSSIAGDQTSGTMKMIAIRPYTRNKLFSGKFLSCFMFGLMLILISFIASFVVGTIMYGLPVLDCLVVFNSQEILVLNPYILLGIYMFSLILNLIFYISLAMFISLIFKSNTLSVLLSTILFGTQIVLNGLIDKTWLNYTPWGHFDLFKYFGNGSTGFLQMNILPNADFTVSAIVLIGTTLLLDIFSHFIFERKDIA